MSERLETIQKIKDGMVLDLTMKEKDWIIERIEKAEQLEAENKRLRGFVEDLAGEETLHQKGELKTEMRRLLEGKKRMRAALEEIATCDNILHLTEAANIAREALKGGGENE